MSKVKAENKFPDRVYVKWEEDGDGDKFLLCYADPKSISLTDESILVGVYTLGHEAIVTAPTQLEIVCKK